MKDYALITSRVSGSADETLARVKRAISSDEAYVGHIVDESSRPATLVVIVASGDDGTSPGGEAYDHAP